MNDSDRPFSAQCGTPIAVPFPANPRADAICVMSDDQKTAMLAWLAGAEPDIFDKARFAAL